MVVPLAFASEFLGSRFRASAAIGGAIATGYQRWGKHTWRGGSPLAAASRS